MKVGDLVRSVPAGILINSKKVGIVVEITQRKCWRTAIHGKKVRWGDIEPEPHAVVLFNDRDTSMTIPVADLEVVDYE